MSKAESRLFDRHFHATGKAHREFCQLFGPDKIVENLGRLLGHFMVAKVIAGESLKRAAGTVCKKLSKWLGEKGYVSEDFAEDAAIIEVARAAGCPEVLFEDLNDGQDYDDVLVDNPFRDVVEQGGARRGGNA